MKINNNNLEVISQPSCNKNRSPQFQMIIKGQSLIPPVNIQNIFYHNQQRNRHQTNVKFTHVGTDNVNPVTINHYPYEFSYHKPVIQHNQNTNGGKKLTHANPMQRLIIGQKSNVSGLGTNISNHANPIGNKHLYPILKPGSRPNSEDNKYQYMQNEKQSVRRAQSQQKSEYKEGETAISHKQTHTNKSPFKPANHNQYTQPQPHSNAQTQNHAHFQQSETVSECKNCHHAEAGPTNNFLGKCLQHIMIQNSCLTKQVVIKEMQLTRLRQQLYKMKQKYLSFNRNQIDLESLNAIDTISQANQSIISSGSQILLDNSNNERQIRGRKENIKSRKGQKNWIQNKSEKMSMEQKQQYSELDEYSFAEQIKQEGQPNLEEIEQLIKEIEIQERKLLRKQQQVEDQQNKARHTIGEGMQQQYHIRQPVHEQQLFNQKESRDSGNNNIVSTFLDQGHHVDGLEFTRLDRLRMKKGLVSRREQVGALK